MANTDFKIEVFGLEHVEGLVALYETVFKRRESEDYFRIKYGINLIEQYSLVLLKEESVIGFIGIIPQVFSKGKEELKMAFYGDFILQEAYRGQGIFNHLYDHATQKLVDANFAYLYAFQSTQTFKVCQKLDWISENDLVRFHIHVWPKFIGSFISKFGLSNTVQKTLEKKLKPYRIDLDKSVIGREDNWSLKPTSEFFEMKKFQPRHFVEIEGCKLWLKFDYRISVGFIAIQNNSDLERMLSILKSIARKSGVFEVVFHLLPKSKEAKELARFIEQKDSFKLSYLPLRAGLPNFSELHLDLMNGDMF